MKNRAGVGLIETEIPGLNGCYHPLNSDPTMTMVEFFSSPPRQLKQVLMLPNEAGSPDYLKNENVIPYRFPNGSIVTGVTVAEGRINEIHVFLAQIKYEFGGKPYHHEHIVLGE